LPSSASASARRRFPSRTAHPGDALHIDNGWMSMLERDEHGRRRRFRAWIFTPHLSRYRFVYPC
jgi:hypothetical protein